MFPLLSTALQFEQWTKVPRPALTLDRLPPAEGTFVTVTTASCPATVFGEKFTVHVVELAQAVSPCCTRHQGPGHGARSSKTAPTFCVEALIVMVCVDHEETPPFVSFPETMSVVLLALRFVIPVGA
jgi:hypothetical protein